MKKLLSVCSLILALAMLLSFGVLAAEEPQVPGICNVQTLSADVSFKALDANGVEVANDAAGAAALGAANFYPTAVQLRVTLSNQSNGAFRFLRVQDVEGVFQEQNLVYIDQVTVTGGQALYEHVYPSELHKGATYHAYVTGNDGYVETEILTFGYHQSYTLGDVDDNGKIGTKDALWTLQAYAGNRTLDATQTLAADVDHNSKIGTKDALWILQAYAGNRVLE